MKFKIVINYKEVLFHCPACGETNFARRHDSFKNWVRCMNCGVEILAEYEYGQNPTLKFAWEENFKTWNDARLVKIKDLPMMTR